MRFKPSFLAAVIATGLFSVNGYAASAEPTPSPSPSIDSFRAAQEQFRRDRDLFILALRDRDMKMGAINATFKSAVDKAISDAKTAMVIAATPEQKNLINSNRRAAVAAAIVARENAIAALGPLPSAPLEPVKSAKSAPLGNPEQKSKQKR